VSGHDDGEGPPPPIPPGSGDSADQDVLEHGGRALPSVRQLPLLRWLPPPGWRPRIPRLAILLVVAGLLAGAVAGYTAGDRDGRAGAPAPVAATASPASALGGATLSQSGNECSAQLGNDLQLGVQVTNGSPDPLTLREITVVLPLGGLRAITVDWGPCGQLPAATEDPPQNDATDRYLPAGGSGWLNVTVAVLATCPGPFPVQFVVKYAQNGRLASVRLPGFADLGNVPYRTCSPAQGFGRRYGPS
jgi:hypothetical protein